MDKRKILLAQAEKKFKNAFPSFVGTTYRKNISLMQEKNMLTLRFSFRGQP